MVEIVDRPHPQMRRHMKLKGIPTKLNKYGVRIVDYDAIEMKDELYEIPKRDASRSVWEAHLLQRAKSDNNMREFGKLMSIDIEKTEGRGHKWLANGVLMERAWAKRKVDPPSLRGKVQ